MKIFISYGHDDDSEFACRLKKDLVALGHEVWMDEDKIHPSQFWEVSIEKGINSSDWIIAVMTPHSMRRPDGVCLDELSYARFQNKPIAPIMVRMVQPPLIIARIQWLDMQNWKCEKTGSFQEEQYKEKFKMLLRVLNGEFKLGFEGEHTRLRSLLKPIENGAEISKHIKMFIGREWIFKAYEKWLAQDESRVFWVKGNAGIGKTAFAAMLCHQEPTVIGVHFCKYNDSDRADPKRAITSLAYHLATQNMEYMHYLLTLTDLDTIYNKSVRALFNYLFVEPLQCISQPNKKVIIVIDALDESDRDGKSELVSVIVQEFEKLPPWFGIVITSRPDPQVIRKFSRFKPYVLDNTDPENMEDIRAYLNLHLDYIKDESIKYQVTEALMKKSEGVFLYIKETLKDIERGFLTIENLDSFPNGLTGVYLNNFERQFTEEQGYKKHQRPLFELLVSSQEPLNIDMAAEILNWDDYDLGDALESLGSIFLIQNKILEPFHKTVIDWLICRDKGGRFYVSEKKGNERFCEFIIKGTIKPTSQKYINRYGPYHLYKNNKLQEIVKLMETNDEIASSLSDLILLEIQSDTSHAVNEKIKELLYLIANDSGSTRIEKLFVSLISLLIEYSLYVSAKEINQLIQESYKKLEWLTYYIDFRISRMIGQPKRVTEIGRKLLEIEHLPSELLGTTFYFLADGLREQGNHVEAIRFYKLALENINRHKDISFWLKATCALGDMEYVYGFLHEATERFQDALSISKKHGLLLMEGSIYRMLGNVEHIKRNLQMAQQYFFKSLEISLKVKRPYSIVESYNSLAEAQRESSPDEALQNVRQARKYAQKYNVNLEYGKGYYIEADIYSCLDNFEKAEYLARQGLDIMQKVGYGSGIARTKSILANALIHQCKYEDAIENALYALKYYQEEEIYPSLRIETYDMFMQCLDKLGRSNKYKILEDVANIPNINNFPHAQHLLDRYSKM